MTINKPTDESAPEIGDTYVHEHVFDVDEVRQFADLSGDTQPQHVEPDENGRLMVHGLLTSTVLTKIGGDLEMLAYSMDLSFRRPVYTGDRVTCTWTNEAVEERTNHHVTASIVCRNQQDEVVLQATVEGVVP